MSQQIDKSQVAKGMGWTALERFGSQLIQFLIGLMLARLLMPDDYGLIGMLAIFIAISQVFLDSGFANALIQKKDRSDADYSTVFWFNLMVSLLIYGILYVAAPFIARFYSQPLLCSVTRVYSLSIIINGLSIVQTARLSIELNFRLQAVVSIIAIVVSGAIGIVMAVLGAGVWALVWQGIASAGVRTLLLWVFGGWKPLTVFSGESFRTLFSFGSKLLVSSMINSIYSNLATLVIGRAFHAAELGFYSRARQFATLPSDTATSIVTKVSFPVLTRYQDNDAELLRVYSSLLRTPVYLLYPVVFGIAVLAGPVIEALIGAKWLDCVPLLQILSIGVLWTPLTMINLNLLYVKGRSDLVLKLEFIKKPIAFALLISAAFTDIYFVCAALALYEFIAFVFNCYYTGRFLGFGFFRQMRDLLPVLFYCVVMSAAVSTVYLFPLDPWMRLAAGAVIGIIVYGGISLAFRDRSALLIARHVASFISRRTGPKS